MLLKDEYAEQTARHPEHPLAANRSFPMWRSEAGDQARDDRGGNRQRTELTGEGAPRVAQAIGPVPDIVVGGLDRR
jgi:hypothetical protein